MAGLLGEEFREAAAIISSSAEKGDLGALARVTDLFLSLAAANMGRPDGEALREASRLLVKALNASSRLPLSAEVQHYLGALWSLRKLFAEVADQLPTREELSALAGKHAEPLLTALAQVGLCTSLRLSRLAGMRADQVAETTRPLIAAGLVETQRQGKFSLYSVTGRGLIAARHLGLYERQLAAVAELTKKPVLVRAHITPGQVAVFRHAPRGRLPEVATVAARAGAAAKPRLSKKTVAAKRLAIGKAVLADPARQR